MIPGGRFLDAGGVRTFCIERGSGPAVVLLHGASIVADSWIAWFRTIEALAARFRVIAFDQIGFGRSEVPADRRYRNRFERVAHARAVLDALGVEKARLVGHSEGAFLATRLALDEPARVERLVVVTSGGTAPRLGGELDRGWMEASALAYDYGEAAATEDGFIAANGRLKRCGDPQYEAILRENYRRARESGTYEIFRDLPPEETDYDLYTRLQERHILPYLRDLALPVLLVWAREDATVPVSRGLALLDMIPNAELHVFAGTGHGVMLDRPADFNRLLLAWLAEP